MYIILHPCARSHLCNVCICRATGLLVASPCCNCRNKMKRNLHVNCRRCLLTRERTACKAAVRNRINSRNEKLTISVLLVYYDICLNIACYKHIKMRCLIIELL